VLVVSFRLRRISTRRWRKARCRQAARPDRGRLVPGDRADGAVTVYSGKVDLGTGVSTALRQIVAETDVPFSRIALVEGDTAPTPDQGTTWGSLSIQVGGVQIRTRRPPPGALLEEAAKRSARRRDQLTVADDQRRRQARQLRELIGGKRSRSSSIRRSPPRRRIPPPTRSSPPHRGSTSRTR
jgi:CO/xanthine dehydrogenase Mo-binding subunit